MTATKTYHMPNSPIVTTAASPVALIERLHPYFPAGSFAWDHAHDCGVVLGEIVVSDDSKESYAAAASLYWTYTNKNGQEIRAGLRPEVERKFSRGADLRAAMVAAGLD